MGRLLFPGHISGVPPPTHPPNNHWLMTSFLSEGGGIISTWQLHLRWSASNLDTSLGFDTWQDSKKDRSLWERRESTSEIPSWMTENWATALCRYDFNCVCLCVWVGTRERIIKDLKAQWGDKKNLFFFNVLRWIAVKFSVSPSH